MKQLTDMTVSELQKLQCSLCSGWGKEDIKLQRKYGYIGIDEIQQQLLSCFVEQEKRIAQLEKTLKITSRREEKLQKEVEQLVEKVKL